MTAASRPIRAVLEVARHELLDSIRSRRALVLMILYFAGAVAATLLFLKTLHHVENEMERAIGITESRTAGGATQTLWRSDPFFRVITRLTRDRDLARRLVGLPPIAVFYGWLAFTFGPLLVMLMSAPRIAEEVWSGSVRFVLFRTSRVSWCLGKFLGQAAQLLVALFLGALAVWLVGALKFSGFEPGTTALVLLGFSVRAWVYTFAFLGLATGISQVVTSPNIATGGGIFGLIVCTILAVLAQHYAGPGVARLWDVVHQLMPRAHLPDLWRGTPASLLRGSLFCIVLGLAYLLLGYARFARRDL